MPQNTLDKINVLNIEKKKIYVNNRKYKNDYQMTTVRKTIIYNNRNSINANQQKLPNTHVCQEINTNIKSKKYVKKKSSNHRHIEQSSDTSSIEQEQSKNRNQKYNCISNDLRIKLIDYIVERGEKIKNAAKKLDINYSSAKSIYQVFKREGRKNKKSSHKPDTEPKTDSNPLVDEIEQYAEMEIIDETNPQSIQDFSGNTSSSSKDQFHVSKLHEDLTKAHLFKKIHLDDNDSNQSKHTEILSDMKILSSDNNLPTETIEKKINNDKDLNKISNVNISQYSNDQIKSSSNIYHKNIGFKPFHPNFVSNSETGSKNQSLLDIKKVSIINQAVINKISNTPESTADTYNKDIKVIQHVDLCATHNMNYNNYANNEIYHPNMLYEHSKNLQNQANHHHHHNLLSMPSNFEISKSLNENYSLMNPIMQQIHPYDYQKLIYSQKIIGDISIIPTLVYIVQSPTYCIQGNTQNLNQNKYLNHLLQNHISWDTIPNQNNQQFSQCNILNNGNISSSNDSTTGCDAEGSGSGIDNDTFVKSQLRLHTLDHSINEKINLIPVKSDLVCNNKIGIDKQKTCNQSQISIGKKQKNNTQNQQFHQMKHNLAIKKK